MKVAVITGAASGIGRELTLAHLKRNDMVIIVDIDEGKLNSTLNEFQQTYPNQILAYPCDITKTDAIDGLILYIKKQNLPIHWLYNNAGIIGTIAPLWELQHEQIQKVIDVNLSGTIHMIQAFIPLMFEQPHTSHIINIASLYALCSGSQLAPYAMTKHAVLALSESLYFDLQRLNKPIQVSVAFPSFTATGLINNSPADINPGFHEALQQLISRSRPADEIAELIIEGVLKGQFYILPDKEVKSYCEERTQAIIEQRVPHQHSLERLLSALGKRNRRQP